MARYLRMVRREYRRCCAMYGRGDVVTRELRGQCRYLAALLIAGESL